MMTSKEIFDLLRQTSSNDDEFLEVLCEMLGSVAGQLQISGSKNDVYDAAECLMKAAGHGVD
jgi:hypothetical protein